MGADWIIAIVITAAIILVIIILAVCFRKEESSSTEPSGKSLSSEGLSEESSSTTANFAPAVSQGPFSCRCVGTQDGSPHCGNDAVVASSPAEHTGLSRNRMIENYGPCRTGEQKTGWICFDADDEPVVC